MKPSRVPRLARIVLCSIVALLSAGLGGTAAADAPADAHREAIRAANQAAFRAIRRGPAEIPLNAQAHLALPEHYGFIPRPEAAALMKAVGNSTGDTFLGLIVPLDDDKAGWLITMLYEPSGYIKDDDAKHWDADKLLESLKEGTEAGNAQRIEVGVPPVKVTRWIAPPSYQAEQHRLVWAAEVVNKEGHDDDPGVNYNTYVLGREGYLSLDLVTSVAAVEQDKPAVHRILDQIRFEQGKGYGDFNASTDKVAAYGLAALVAGVAAKKLGLLALLGITIVKYAKLLLIAAAGIGAGIRKWFQNRRGAAPAAADPGATLALADATPETPPAPAAPEDRTPS
jgi:uncharacterized membrane-anchored protein